MAGTLFKNVTVIDGTGADAAPGEVLVEGNRIKQVARDGAAIQADGAEVVDGGGATLMPGLVEAHAHISFCNVSSLEALGDMPPEEHTLATMKYAKLLLDQGFTALFSAAAAKARLDVVIRNAIDDGEIPGPRMKAASPELAPTGGLGDVRRGHMYRETFAICADGADEFRKVSREMCREGVDTLKINPSGDEFVPFARAHQTVMNEDEVAAVSEVARAHDKMCAAHARSAESVKMCVRQGYDVIYHATLCDEEALDMVESVKDKVFIAPAINVMYATGGGEGAKWGITDDHPVAIHFQRELERCVESMKALKQRGVRILPGGDYGFAWTPLGTNARDLEHFVKLLDFTPMEAICAATKLGGEIMGMGDELGQIRQGYLADLLLVDGNPLADVTLLREQDNLLAIMKDGQFHKRPATRAAAVQAAE